ncbi:hypothetical protein [Oceanithermus sp.]
MGEINGRLERLASLDERSLRRELARLWEVPPSKGRDAMLAMVLLRLSQLSSGADADRYFLFGYSYSRTSRDPRLRALAEELRARLG